VNDAVVSVPEAEVLPALAEEAVPERRRVGRPKGSGNKSLVTERRIRQHNDARSFLHRVVKGGKIKAAVKTGDKVRQWCVPTVPERLKAAEYLLRDAHIVDAAAAGFPGGAVTPAMVVNIQIVAGVSP
jgi:hypothetical protein